MHGSKIQYLWNDLCAPRDFVSGVSLHSHTNQSKETLDFLANLGRQYPWIRPLITHTEQYCRDKFNIEMDYAHSYWSPPLTPRLAFELEGRQIERLGIAPLVSITDHDTIQAPMLLRTIASARHIPVSLEWTTPFGGDQAFHLGIHNLPSESGTEWMSTLEQFTEHPSDTQLTELLSALHALPNVLIVFNHPLWDLYLIGEQKHSFRVRQFMQNNGEFIHALELNGLRNRDENHLVKKMARAWDKLVISGGDRHGIEPNANINLSNATTFTEFVHEVRYQNISNVLFMPQYREPWKHRILQSTLDAIRDYPDLPQGSQRWDERVYHPDREGILHPVSELWHQGEVPRAIYYVLEAVKLLGNKAISNSLRLAWMQPHESHLALGEQEAF